MNSHKRNERSITSWLIAGSGLLAAYALIIAPDTTSLSSTGVLLSTGLIGLLSLSRMPIGGRDVNLAHSVSIASALYYGPLEAIIALAAGLLIGEFIHQLINERRSILSNWKTRINSWASSFGHHSLSLAISIYSYFLLDGVIPLRLASLESLNSLVAVVIGFLLPFVLIQWLKDFGRERIQLTSIEVFTFILIIGFLPLPYSIVTAGAASILGDTALVVLGGGPAVVAPIVRSLLLAERDLQRRVNELSTLGEVSQAMRTSLNLEAILHTIYLQVAHLLDVRNFYVALHDTQQDLLTYPLAIKAGNRQDWSSRPLSDRLTDRVIRTGQPLLIPENAPSVLRSMGMPELNNAPEAWLGVPLQTPSRVLGCLGVFHLAKPGSFSKEDQDLLITVAGQAAVAIENAMLYDQTRQRARALASLNEISTQMSSSLDPDQTLRLVAESLIRVVGGQGAAIYLKDQDEEALELAQATGLPPVFLEEYSHLSLSDPALTSAYHSGQLQSAGLDPDSESNESRFAMTQEAGYKASIDLPLSTPSGPLGMATVFFSDRSQIDDEQLVLLETFVAQSALAVANARAHAATDQALKRQVDQLSRLESIAKDMVSTLEPEDLFEVILSSALEATGAPIGHLALAAKNPIQLRLVAHHGFGLDDQFANESAQPAEQFGLTGKAFLENQTIVVEDLRQIAEHVDWTDTQSKSLLVVPIHRWGRSLGVLTVESDKVGSFADEQTRFLSQVASYASVAITNANLYQQLEDNLKELSLLYQASAQITSSMDLESVAYAIADSLMVSIDAEAAGVYRNRQRDQDLERLAFVSQSSHESPKIQELADKRSDSIEETIETGVPAHFEIGGENGQFTAMALPLQIGAQPIGAIEVLFPSPHEFTEAEIRTSQTIASQAAVALQNTELFRRIRESRDRLDAVINSTKEGILMVDQDGTIMLVNRPFQRMLEVDEDELVGRSLTSDDLSIAQRLDLASGKDPAAQFSPLSESESSDNPTTLHLDSKQVRVIERMVRAVSDAEGGKIGWLIVIRDVSQQHELDETREQLVEMIVHDLRSPLTTIKGSLSLLNRTLPEEKRSEVTAQALSVSDRAASQMLGLVNSLLDLARLENDPLEVDREELELEPILTQLTEIYVPEANKSGLILETKIDEELPPIHADAEKLRRVITNLLDNAVKFTPEGGQIVLSAQAKDEANVLITVADDGPGVPEDMREKIFERFSQVSGTAGRRRGTGLGLAFAKLAIEAHGGRIWVESSNGQGSRFQILLPQAG